MDKEVSAALIGGSASILTAVVAYLVQKAKERKSAQKDTTLAFRREQIEKFYGPLHNILTQLVTYDAVLEGIRGAGSEVLNHEQRAQLGRFFYRNYFVPLHEEAGSVIKRNMHLIRNRKTADLIVLYLRHSLQEVTQNRLDAEMNISTLFLQGTPFPCDLAKAVKEDLDQIYKEITELE